MLACPVRWLLKASAQKVLGAAPGGRSANYLLQRHVARSLPRGEAAFARKFRRALRHLDAYSARHRGAVAGAVHEFGPGWDLVVALAFRALGVERQTLVDVARVARPELVNDTRQARAPGARPRSGERTFASSARTAAPIPGRARRAFRDHVSRPAGSERHRVAECVIRLRLEHVNPRARAEQDDIGPLLEECRRLLAAGGDELHVDLRDHFSFMDGSLSPYNFLRFDTRRWRLLSSPLNYQNRLRYPDYLALFRSAGFEVVEERAVEPSGRTSTCCAASTSPSPSRAVTRPRNWA